MKVVVIGGGVAGLTAALHARRCGAEVTLFEAGERIGGQVESRRKEGWTLELGAPTSAEPSAEVRQLLEQVGLDEFLIRPAAAVRRRYLVHQGTPVPLPSRASELLASPLFSLAGRLRLLREPLIERGLADPEESVDSFVRRRLGAEAAERLIDPWLAGSSGGDPTAVLASRVFPRLAAYEQQTGSILKGAWQSRRRARRRGESAGLWSCRGGMSTLIEGIGASLGSQLHCNSPLSSISINRQGFALRLKDDSAVESEALILAIPPTALSQIRWEGVDREDLELVASIPCSSMAVVAVGLPRSAIAHPLDGVALLVAARERRDILSVQFSSTVFPDHAPADQVLLTVTVGGARRPELVELSDQDLRELVLTELRELLGARGEPTLCEIVRWRAALPQAVRGHAARLAAADRLELAAPGLALAGGWREGASLKDAMQSGWLAAGRVVGGG